MNKEENFALALAKFEDERLKNNLKTHNAKAYLRNEFSLNINDENISTKVYDTITKVWREGTVEVFIKNNILSDRLEVQDLVAFDSARFSKLVLVVLAEKILSKKEAWGLLFLNASRIQDAFEDAEAFTSSYFKGALFYDILFNSEEENRGEKIQNFDNLVQDLQKRTKVKVKWLNKEVFETFSIKQPTARPSSLKRIHNWTKTNNNKLNLMYAYLAKEDKSELWNYLDKLTQKERNKLLNHLYIDKKNGIEILSSEDYLELPALYPSVSYAHYLRGVYFYHFAWEARGLGITNTVGQKNYALFYERLRYARKDLKKAYELSSTEQTYWGELYNLVKHFKNKESDTLEKELYALIQEHAMQNTFCIERVSHLKKARWGGSHKENLTWAREVVSHTKQGDAMKIIIFEALIEQYHYILEFDRDEERANAVFKEEALQEEVNQYFDELLASIEQNSKIASSLLFWYEKVGDEERIKKLRNTVN